MTGLVNLMEKTVLDTIDLPPRYVQSFEGKMLHQFEARTTQTDVEITAVVFQGIKIVGEEPHKNTNEY